MTTTEQTTLLSIVQRTIPPAPWVVGRPLAWHEPDFSARMLREHLSQAHDAASRRTAVIDAQVEWLHRVVLGGQPTHVLDLACGPGLYTTRLAALGHACSGIDIAPAAIAYAREQAALAGASTAYRLADLRTAAFGSGFGLLLLNYGALNMFPPDDARSILTRAAQALRPGGRLVLELHPDAAVQASGMRPPRWRSMPQGLFGDAPYLVLEEAFWDAATSVAMHRMFVVDAATASVTCWGETLQAYSDVLLRDLLAQAGLVIRDDIAAPPPTAAAEDLVFIVAERASMD